MRTIFAFICVVLSAKLLAQNKLHSSSGFLKYKLDIISKTPHLFVDDSVFVINESTVDSYKTERFENLDILQIKDSFYKKPGGGTIYKMNASYGFEPVISKPKMEQSFFQATTFIRKDTIFQYGGYGNFSQKNDLIYLDEKLQTWEYYPYGDTNKIKPPNGAVQFYNFNNDTLTVLGIIGESPTGKQSDNILWSEVWEFSFRTKT